MPKKEKKEKNYEDLKFEVSNTVEVIGADLHIDHVVTDEDGADRVTVEAS